jgi:hypothetical protein
MWGCGNNDRKAGMTRVDTDSAASAPDEVAPRRLNPAASRALAEAQARRAGRHAEALAGTQVREIGGRGGLEPVRYGDWEVKGLATDF